MTDRPGGAGRPRHLRVVDADTARAHEERAADAVQEYVLGLLGTRARTRAELVTALDRRGVDPDVAAGVLDRLTAVGLVDDRAVAAAYAEREAARKGPRAVAEALRRKGIDAETAREVAHDRSPDDVRAAALVLARQKLPTWRGQPPEVVRRRLAGLLARRGFGAGTVYGVVREVVGDDGGDGVADSAETQIWLESEGD